MKRHVAVGCSTQHDYSAFLPVVGVLWRERIGYEPIFFLIGSYESWRECRHKTLVPDTLNQMGFRVEWVDAVEGVEDATVSQSIRLHAAALDDLGADDLLIPSDADLLPIRKDFYCQHDIGRWPIASYYFNAYHNEERTHLPTCHISATVKTWREFMGLAGSDPRDCLLRSFDSRDLKTKIAAKQLDPKKSWGHVWFEDEFNLSERILRSRFWPDGVQRILRDGQPPKDRLDRACWPETYNPYVYTDCHSIRPFWSEENWPRLLPLFKATIDMHKWGGLLAAFREEFKAAILETV